MAMPMEFYRNPEELLLRAEAQTCKGCAHESSVMIAGERYGICEKGKQHGRRCRRYEEADA